MLTSFSAITCQVWNYTWPLLTFGDDCESNHTVEWPTRCVFECAYGYLLVGNDTATCQLDGTLDAEPPECIREYGGPVQRCREEDRDRVWTSCPTILC